MAENLNGFIERVTYHNPENGFAVLRVKVKGRGDLATVVGTTTSVTAGEHVEATGRWSIDPQHGQQFKADELKTTHPASPATSKPSVSGSTSNSQKSLCNASNTSSFTY